MFNVSLHLCSVHSSITSLPTTPLVPVFAGVSSKLEKTWLQSSGKPASVTQYCKRAETPKSRHCTLHCCPCSCAGTQPNGGYVTPAWHRESLGWWGSPGPVRCQCCWRTWLPPLSWGVLKWLIQSCSASNFSGKAATVAPSVERWNCTALAEGGMRNPHCSCVITIAHM